MLITRLHVLLMASSQQIARPYVNMVTELSAGKEPKQRDPKNFSNVALRP